MSNVHLSIGTSVTGDRINLIDPNQQAVYDWEPSETPLADTFSGSTLGDGRTLSSYREENAIESMRIHLKATTSDDLIRRSQNIRRMLIKARNYWVTSWQGYPVYLQARGACETNYRYALVYAGALPSDVLPWGTAFARAQVMHERVLTLERGPWLDVVPGTGTCVTLSAQQTMCYPSYLVFGGVNDWINAGSDALLDDLPSGGIIFVDGWIRPTSWPAGAHTIIAKTEGTLAGWIVQIETGKGLISTVYCDGAADAYSESGVDEFTVDSDWHYFAMAYDDTGGTFPAAKTIYLNVDGAWVASYVSQTQGVGAYSLDAILTLCIGSTSGVSEFFIGDIGWVRVSDAALYTPGLDYDAPERCDVPPITANTMGLWIYEGDGATTGNAASPGGTAGIINPAPEWECDCDRTVGYPAPADPITGYSPGVEVGSFTKVGGGAGASQDIVFTHPFRPQILFLFASSAQAVDTPGGINDHSYGMACEDANDVLYQCSMSWHDATGAVNNTDNAGYQSNTHAIVTIDNLGAPTSRGVVTFNDDGFSITWSTNDNLPEIIGFAALRSNFITNCKILTWASGTGLGNQDVTGVGFQPYGLIDLGGQIYAAMPGGRYSYYCGLGMTDGTNLYASGWSHVDAYAPIGGVPKALQLAASGLHYVPNSAAVPSERNRFNFVSFLADGFRIDHTVNYGTAYYHHTLCLEGTNFQTNTFNATGPGAQNVTSMSFQPHLVLFHTNNTTAGAAAFGSTHYAGLGAADSYLNNAVAAGRSKTVNPTECDRLQSSANCIAILEPHLTLDTAGALTGMLSNGFSLNWGTWGGTWGAKPVQYFGFKVM